jgi:hypothetical protein
MMNWRCSLGIHSTRIVNDPRRAVNVYTECRRCGVRGVRHVPGSGYQPVRRQWLDGGEWDEAPPPMKVKS